MPRVTARGRSQPALVRRRRCGLDRDLPSVWELSSEALLHPMSQLVSFGHWHGRWHMNDEAHFSLAPQPPHPQVAEATYSRNRSRDARDLAGNFIVVHIHETRDYVAGGVDPNVDDQAGDGKAGEGIGLLEAKRDPNQADQGAER